MRRSAQRLRRAASGYLPPGGPERDR